MNESGPAVEVLTTAGRCAQCGATQPDGDAERCSECNQHLRLAAEPVGRGPAGWCADHPEASVTGVCSHCGAFTCTECDVSVRGIRLCGTCREGLAEQLASPVPWEERHAIGRLTGWWRTTTAVTTRPGSFYDTMDPTRDLGSALWFGLVGATLTAAWPMLFSLMYEVMIVLMTGVMAFAPTGPPTSGPHPMLIMGIASMGLLAFIVATPFITLLGYLLMACLQHLCLRIVGTGGEHGLTATLKVALYALGTGWVGIVPYMGQWAHPFWWTGLMVVGAAKVHGCSTTRALVVVIPVFMVCVAPVVAYIVMLFVMMIVGLLA